MEICGKVIRRLDGSYVIDNGMFHVPNEGEFRELWDKVHAYATSNPDNIDTDKKINILDIEQKIDVRCREIKTSLDDIDKKKIRPISAILMGIQSNEDVDMLASLEKQAEILRSELKNLGSSTKSASLLE